MARLAQKVAQGKTSPAKPESAKAARRPASAARKPAFMQAKLAVSHPQDAEERQADQVAAEVSRTPRAVQRASLEPGITPEKKEESLAPKPVPSAARIARMGAAAGDQTPPPLQRLEAEEAAVQTRLWCQREEGEPLQTHIRREAAGGGQGRADRSLGGETEARIEALKGQGDPLPEAVLIDMQARFGRDLTAVRIHTGSEAAALCAEVEARAFTVGNDIFFAPGEYAPQTNAGRELLAHELTHVVQQAGGAQRKLMRLDGEGGGTAAPTGPVQGNCGTVGAPHITYTVDPASNTLRYNQLEVPPFKVPFMQGRNLRRTRGQMREASLQNEHYNDLWRQGVGTASIGTVTAIINRRLDQHYQGGPRPAVYAFRARNGFRRGSERNPQFRHFIGTAEEVARELAFPTWNKNGELTSFEVDHKWELQLGGPNELTNFWLLNATTNGRSGIAIRNKLRNVNAKGFSDNEKAKPEGERLPGTDSSDQVLANYDIVIDQPVPDTRFTPADDPLPPRYYWTQEEITGGQHMVVDNLDHLLEVDDLSRLGGDGRVKIFPQQGGGGGKFFTTQPRLSEEERDWMKPWQITAKQFYTSEENAEVLAPYSCNCRVPRPPSPSIRKPSPYGVIPAPVSQAIWRWARTSCVYSGSSRCAA